jgi:uncharacterized protein YceH (UPF0502 family)
MPVEIQELVVRVNTVEEAHDDSQSRIDALERQVASLTRSLADLRATLDARNGRGPMCTY